MPKNPVNMENTERQMMAHDPEMLWPTILIHFYCLALSLHTGQNKIAPNSKITRLKTLPVKTFTCLLLIVAIIGLACHSSLHHLVGGFALNEKFTDFIFFNGKASRRNKARLPKTSSAPKTRLDFLKE